MLEGKEVSAPGLEPRVDAAIADAPRPEGGLDGLFLLSGKPPFEERYSEFARLFRLKGPYSLEERER